MKHLILLFLFLPTYTSSQNNFDISIDTIPVEGLLLNKGWKWHEGDNPAWAKIDFDHSKWEGIDPSLVIPELQSNISNQPLWLRLKFNNRLKKNSLILSVKQSGATEIYINNHKIHSFGIIDTLNNRIKSYDPNGEYISLPLDTVENILAIKYYFEKGVKYKSVFDARFPLFSARIFTGSTTVESNKNKTAFFWEGVNVGVPLILFIVHFIIFLFYQPIRANLWYSLWALGSAIGSFFLLRIKIEHHLALKNDYSLYGVITMGLAGLSLVYSLFLLLRKSNKKWFVVLWGLTILSIITFLSESPLSPTLDFGVNILFKLIVLYIAYSAYKQGNIGAKYVVYCVVLYTILWILFVFSFDLFNTRAISDILFHLAMFCLPIMISILLGIDTRNIHYNLMSVTLEKQQLLENQNQVLEKEVTERTAALNKSIKNLQSTQTQLIQSEKMASLGELTAGIAHEIQNPLNFVNNFAEINNELIKELEEAASSERRDASNEAEIIATIKENSEKINHHGKRAESIVRGMLQHSRKSTSIKESTDINSLADEYMRLSYHGLRAKDKSFNAEFKIDLDPTIPLTNVIPQDIGRVFLNLFNNAFWAVNEKQQDLNKRKTVDRIQGDINRALGSPKSVSDLGVRGKEDGFDFITNLAGSSDAQASTNLQGSSGFSPSVALTTKNLGETIEIRIADNGPGIPPNIIDKIFQPFFTTKPTGQGTGLGLSLAYDIIKAHGGTIDVRSEENKFTEFIIQLPVKD